MRISPVIISLVALLAVSHSQAAPDWNQSISTTVSPQVQGAPIKKMVEENWERIPGCAKNIAAGGVNQVMVVGCGNIQAVDTVYEWKSGQFVAEPQGSVMLSFKRDGVVFKEDKRLKSEASWLAIDGVAGKVYAIGPDAMLYSRNVTSQYPHYQWTKFVGYQTSGNYMQLTAVAAGGGSGNGALWAVSTQPNGAGGNKIHMTQACTPQDNLASGKCWRDFPGAAQKIAIGGDVWVVNTDGGIFRRSGNGWEGVAGCARDVAASGEHVYVVGCDYGEGGANKIYRRTGGTWKYAGRTGKTLAVDVAGTAWVVTATGEIWRQKTVTPDAIR
ncbi:MAG: hypothetical protein Q8L73_02660 [Methylotenera sp.]|nr:hypothetical protein [Methylotenera sp.]